MYCKLYHMKYVVLSCDTSQYSNSNTLLQFVVFCEKEGFLALNQMLTFFWVAGIAILWWLNDVSHATQPKPVSKLLVPSSSLCHSSDLNRVISSIIRALAPCGKSTLSAFRKNYIEFKGIMKHSEMSGIQAILPPEMPGFFFCLYWARKLERRFKKEGGINFSSGPGKPFHLMDQYSGVTNPKAR